MFARTYRTGGCGKFTESSVFQILSSLLRWNIIILVDLNLIELLMYDIYLMQL